MSQDKSSYFKQLNSVTDEMADAIGESVKAKITDGEKTKAAMQVLVDEGFTPIGGVVINGKVATLFEKAKDTDPIPTSTEALDNLSEFTEKEGKPAAVIGIRERMIESRKAAAEIVANFDAAAMAKLEEALNLPMEERMAKRLEIIKKMTQEEINACFVNGMVSIGELAEGMGLPEVIYPTVVLTPGDLKEEGTKLQFPNLNGAPTPDEHAHIRLIAAELAADKTLLEDIRHEDIGGHKLGLDLPISFVTQPETTEGGMVIRRGRVPRRREIDGSTYYEWGRATPEPVKFLGIFKERTPGVYISNAGLVAKEEPRPDADDWTVWVIRDQDGKELARSSYLFDLSREGNKVGEFYSYQQRTGRRGDTHMDMKFGLAHFPQGTVFQVRHDSRVKAYTEEMKPYEGIDTFTVDKVSYNGPGSILISCVEQRPGLIHKEVLEPFMYNVSCVVKIISRGKGKVVVDPDTPVGSQTFEEWLAYNDREVRGLIENEKTPYPKLRRGETLFFSPSSVAGILTAPGVKFDETMNAGKYVSDEKWNKFLVSTNCVRYIHLNKVGAWSFGFYAVNVKKFSRWLKKNAHRVFHNLHECQKQDAEADHRFSSEMM